MPIHTYITYSVNNCNTPLINWGRYLFVTQPRLSLIPGSLAPSTGYRPSLHGESAQEDPDPGLQPEDFPHVGTPPPFPHLGAPVRRRPVQLLPPQRHTGHGAGQLAVYSYLKGTYYATQGVSGISRYKPFLAVLKICLF